MLTSKRYLGLELAGAKNQKTALAALEYYPSEKKIFLIDIFDRIAGENSNDEALLELISELKGAPTENTHLGVNVPLGLPPCISCTKKACPLPGKCGVPAVKWMRESTRKAQRSGRMKVNEFTPYTQRPIELWVRYHVLARIPESYRFDIDETLGGNRAPLTARIHFLRRHLSELPMVEVWPKLTVSLLALELKLEKWVISGYRHLERGIHAREEFLGALTEAHGIFIYERDIRKLSQSLTSFDAFICAYSALLADTQRCHKAPAGFPVSSGWIEYPRLD